MRQFFQIICLLNLVGYAYMGAIGVANSDERYLLAALGHLGVVCVLFFPVLSRRNITIFEPFTLFILYVHIGTLAASYVLAFGSGRRRDVMMNGDPVEFFLFGGAMLALALLLVGLGYTACSRRLPAEKIIPSDTRFNATGLHLVAIVVFFVALVATIQFLQSTGGVSLQALSRKRAVEIRSGGEIVLGNAGYLRLAAGLSMTMLYVMLANFLRKPYKMTWSAKLIIFALLLIGVALPFFSSSRGSVLFAFIALFLTYSLYRQMTPQFLISILAVVLVMFSLMTTLRNAAQQGTTGGPANPLVALAESGNGMSLNGTAHILDGVPERMGFKYGTSYLTWITAPIPRRFWPGKPDVSMGKEIKEKVFQQTVIKSGRPPSVITEGYINFGWIGFFAAAFGFGYLCRLIANSFLPILTNGVFAVAIYFPICLHFATLANAASAQAIVRILSDVIPVYAIFAGAVFLSVRRKSIGMAMVR